MNEAIELIKKYSGDSYMRVMESIALVELAQSKDLLTPETLMFIIRTVYERK